MPGTNLKVKILYFAVMSLAFLLTIYVIFKEDYYV
jgi:hypothetical protein